MCSSDLSEALTALNLKAAGRARPAPGATPYGEGSASARLRQRSLRSAGCRPLAELSLPEPNRTCGIKPLPSQREDTPVLLGGFVLSIARAGT